ncbi:MAG TPA: hypothetical protein PKA34_17280, partial [Blastocatellia bacterium]|nr:hypothetical protein [Blastocatellia bacterium]
KGTKVKRVECPRKRDHLTAPEDDPRAVELYFLRLEEAGLGKLKRPDLLIFRERDRAEVEKITYQIANIDPTTGSFEEAVRELPFTSEDHALVQQLLAKAIIAVECENSLWVARKMPLFGSSLRPQRRLGGKLGLAKNAVLPTVILKDEDRHPLLAWQAHHNVPIHIWHVFYDLAFGLALEEAERLIAEGLIEPISQVFQAPGGQTTTKSIFKIYYHYAYELGEAVEQPALIAAHIIDKSGHVLPYVKFDGGSLTFKPQALSQLNKAAEAGKR